MAIITAGGRAVCAGRRRLGRRTAVAVGMLTLGAVLMPLPASAGADSGGTVVGWGYNVYGQTDVPAGLSGVTAVAGGTHHSLALKSDGTVVGRLRMRFLDEGSPMDPAPGETDTLAFYRHDYVLGFDGSGKALSYRQDFVRDANGGVQWFRFDGRLYRKP